MNYSSKANYEFADREINLQYTSNDYERKFWSLIEEGNVEGIKEMMPENYSGSFVVGKLSEDKIRQERYLIIGGAAVLVRVAIAGGLPQSEAMYKGDRLVFMIDKTEDNQEMYRLYSDFVIDLTKSVREVKNFTHNPYVRKADRYIHHHLDKKLTVKEIAQFIGITPNYLSSLFFKDTGENLNEYITKVKINEAKYLLTNTSNTYLSISNNLSFPGQSYFIEKFKKYVGMTPKQYREHNQETSIEKAK